MQRDDRLRNRAELGIRTEHIYISREISIEHPSVGLASLAQLYPGPYTRAVRAGREDVHRDMRAWVRGYYHDCFMHSVW